MRDPAAAPQGVYGVNAAEGPGGLMEGEAVPKAGQGVVVLYREPYGPVRLCSAAGLRGVALEEFGPVSEPVPYRGRKGIITYWPVATRLRSRPCVRDVPVSRTKGRRWSRSGSLRPFSTVRTSAGSTCVPGRAARQPSSAPWPRNMSSTDCAAVSASSY